MQSLFFFLLQMDGKMRPSDRMPDEDLGPLPSLGEYFSYLGLGLACLLVMWILVKIHEKTEEKSKVVSVVLAVLEFAAFLGSGFFLLPVVAVWYTWVFVAGAVLLFFICYSIWDHYSKKRYQQAQAIENKKWVSLASFHIYPAADKPDILKKPLPYMLSGQLECKTEDGHKSFFVDRKYKVEYNPYYKDSSVGEWGDFQFRYPYYRTPSQEKTLAYMYFNLPEDIVSLFDPEHRYSKPLEGNVDHYNKDKIIDDDLPF